MPRGYVGIVVTAQEANKRWRERNPDNVRAANRKKRRRAYDSEASRRRRLRRLAKSGYRERENTIANRRATAIRRWLDAYKLASGCVDCGYRQYHAALHFDHVSGKKELNVCNAKSIAQAQREIAKCVVRCANCHAVKTFTLYPCKPDIFAVTYEPAADGAGHIEHAKRCERCGRNYWIQCIACDGLPEESLETLRARAAADGAGPKEPMS